MINKITVALVHTSPVVTIRQANYFVGCSFDLVIPYFVFNVPFFILIFTRSDNYKAYIRVLFATFYHGLCREGIKSNRAAGEVGLYPM